VSNVKTRRASILIPLLLLTAAAQAQVRKPAVAGSFYPADPKQLANTIDGFLAKAAPPAVDQPILALVSPHAGYEFSGAVAAHGYALLKGRKYDRVIVIAPSHIEAFPFASVYSGEAYETPLGPIAVDRAFCAKLAAGPLIQLSARGHAVTGERGEHALEVQLPFLQRVLGSFRLVPIVMGDQSYAACRALGLAIARQLQGSTGTLILASSDLSHYHPYDAAVKLDRSTLHAIEDWDYLSLSENFERQTWEACGGGPIIAAMIATERLGGGGEPKLLQYANSGDVTNDRTRVVGYGSVAFLKPLKPGSVQAPPFSLTDVEKSELLALARRSVETAVRDRKLSDDIPTKFEALTRDRGAFVTLKERGDLRGCIGYITPTKPLAQTVRDVAAAAAVEDRRFQPVAPAELTQLQYEISVLSPIRRILDVKQIEVGKHGLIMRKGDAMGLLLPQVPVEQHWNRTQFLEETCVKAGLPPNAWKDPDTDIFAFTALVFGEHKP
jgi:MEMO1 family protein